MRQRIRRLADSIQAPSRENVDVAHLRRATVVSIQTADTPDTMTISFAGQTTNVTKVRWLASYTPANNDEVWVLVCGPDMLVLGKGNA